MPSTTLRNESQLWRYPWLQERLIAFSGRFLQVHCSTWVATSHTTFSEKKRDPELLIDSKDSGHRNKFRDNCIQVVNSEWVSEVTKKSFFLLTSILFRSILKKRDRFSLFLQPSLRKIRGNRSPVEKCFESSSLRRQMSI